MTKIITDQFVVRTAQAALTSAIIAADADLLRLLVHLGARLDEFRVPSGLHPVWEWTETPCPLAFAAFKWPAASWREYWQKQEEAGAAYLTVERRVATVEALLDLGMPPDGRDPRRNPLLRFINKKQIAVATLLLDRGANPNAVEDSDWESSCLTTASQLPDAFVDHLIQHGGQYQVREDFRSVVDVLTERIFSARCDTVQRAILEQLEDLLARQSADQIGGDRVHLFLSICDQDADDRNRRGKLVEVPVCVPDDRPIQLALIHRYLRNGGFWTNWDEEFRKLPSGSLKYTREYEPEPHSIWVAIQS